MVEDMFIFNILNMVVLNYLININININMFLYAL